MKKYFIIVNPVSGGRKTAKKTHKICQAIRNSQSDYELFETRPDFYPDQIIRKFYNPSIYSEIIIIGGDGTINQAANAINSTQIPFSIISAGTGNDTVRSVLRTLNLKNQINIALGEKIKIIDTGICNQMNFTNGFGIGFDGKVVENMIKNRKKFKGPLSYFYTVATLLAGYKESTLSISIDGKRIDRTVFLMTVAKGKSFGGGFLLNPYAKNDDGLLDICIINKIPVYKRFFFLPLMKFGIHKSLKEVEFYKCRECMIEFNDKMVAHLDGEFIGNPPFNISIRPLSISVRVN